MQCNPWPASSVGWDTEELKRSFRKMSWDRRKWILLDGIIGFSAAAISSAQVEMTWICLNQSAKNKRGAASVPAPRLRRAAGSRSRGAGRGSAGEPVRSSRRPPIYRVILLIWKQSMKSKSTFAQHNTITISPYSVIILKNFKHGRISYRIDQSFLSIYAKKIMLPSHPESCY